MSEADQTKYIAWLENKVEWVQEFLLLYERTYLTRRPTISAEAMCALHARVLLAEYNKEPSVSPCSVGE